MKNNIKKQLWWVLSLALVTSGCSDFLDKMPENKVNIDNVDYTNLNDMYMPVSGVYATAATKLSAWMAFGVYVVRGDDMEKGGTEIDQVELQDCKNFQYDKITTYWGLNAAWEGFYNLVSIANAAIESLDKYKENITSDTDMQKYDEYKAEVRFIRAFAYFRIVNLWGDVPLLLDNQDLSVEKSTKEEVYQYIYNELDSCIENLPAIRPNEQVNKVGAVTKYSAMALKAKLYMYDNNWDQVLSLTNAIIDDGRFSLYKDFYQLFKIPGKLSNESLYELQYTDFGTGSGDIVVSDNWFVCQGPYAGTEPISGWGLMVPSDAIRSFFAQRGETVRADGSFILTGETTPSGDKLSPALQGLPTAYSGKAYTPSNQMTPGRMEYGDNNNIRLLRYADVLLMNAEAKIRKGQNGDIPLNEVRNRAKLPPITGATLDQVLDERRTELACEWGDRFYDLVRTDKAAEVLPGFVKGQSEYYPIPQNQIDLNPSLK